ncbi:MAG: 16S rRNA processing protein RimM [Desulfobacterales bacterium]|nr:16S rRNA processing protein RimM [Desulfobacterales bacterium]
MSIGEIVGVHGLKGALKARIHAEILSIFQPGDSILIRASVGREAVYTIDAARPHKRIALLFLKEIDGADSARELVGAELFVDRDRLPEIEEDAWYWSDIIGLSVYTMEEEFLGRLTSIIQTGSNDVYVVKNDSGAGEILIPAIESVVRSVDIPGKTMRVDLPEGLRESGIFDRPG